MFPYESTFLVLFSFLKKTNYVFTSPLTSLIQPRNMLDWFQLPQMLSRKKMFAFQIFQISPVNPSVLSCSADGGGDQQATDRSPQGHYGVQWRLRGGRSQTRWRGARNHDQAAFRCGETHWNRHFPGKLELWVWKTDNVWDWATGAGGNLLFFLSHWLHRFQPPGCTKERRRVEVIKSFHQYSH